MKYPIFLILVGVLLLHCKGSESEEATPAPESPAGPDTLLYQVLVNNLRMRTAPNLKSSTVIMLPEESLVQYWGEHSTDKLTINLRGKDITDHWYRIKFGKEAGWVFGGALEIINEKTAYDLLIVPGERIGPVKANDSEASIIKRIGGDKVERGEFMVGEGEAVEATYLFPSTENELILLWDQEDFQTLREVRVRKLNSKWKLATGIGIGSTLTEVTKANNGPFLMSGFEWDYAGTTLNWQGGALSSELTLVFSPPPKLHKALIGDQSISSDDVRLVRANPKVKTIRVLF